jgi:hypothetical protein
LAVEFYDIGDSEIIPSMMKAAARYFEARQLEQPWTKARRLSRELSSALADGRRTVVPQVFPRDEIILPLNFLVGSTDRSGAYDPTAAHIVDAVERLASELSNALNDYQGGEYQAMIWPSPKPGTRSCLRTSEWQSHGHQERAQ